MRYNGYGLRVRNPHPYILKQVLFRFIASNKKVDILIVKVLGVCQKKKFALHVEVNLSIARFCVSRCRVAILFSILKFYLMVLVKFEKVDVWTVLRKNENICAMYNLDVLNHKCLVEHLEFIYSRSN